MKVEKETVTLLYLTKSLTSEPAVLPILPAIKVDCNMITRTVVGNNSTHQTYSTCQDADIHNLPTIVRVTISQVIPANVK